MSDSTECERCETPHGLRPQPKLAVNNLKGRALILTEQIDPGFNRPEFALLAPIGLRNWYAKEPLIAKRNRPNW